MEPLLVSITETAKALSLGRTSVYELIHYRQAGHPQDGAAAAGDGGIDQAAGRQAGLGAAR